LRPAPIPAVPAAAPAATAPTAAAPAAQERVVALNTIRRRTAAAMARAWQAVPHVLQAVEVDYSRIEAVRRTKGAGWQAREGFELTYLAFLAWATCQAQLRYDQLNARIEGDTLVVSRRVHLGIAVDLNHDGLVVPVIRDAHERNVPGLAREIRRLALGARSNKLRPDDYAQPTYTSLLRRSSIRPRSRFSRPMVFRSGRSWWKAQRATALRFARSACSHNRSIIARSTAPIRPRS
jgi:pyruvate dehydrogenase E2 component (dihydrolipoamide acetyltransferase)